jgi:hypothetical protein
VRRARAALAAGMLLAAVTPGALAAGAAQAQVASAQTRATQTRATQTQATQTQAGQTQTTEAAATQVSLAVTGMTPKWAQPGSTVTVSGTVTNNTGTAIGHLSVRVDFAGVSIDGLGQLGQDITTSSPLAYNPLPGLGSLGSLAPHKTSSWSVSFPAKKAGMTTFGVYPLTAHVDNSLGTALAYANTFLPYVPARHGRYAKSTPARQRIAWLWPMMDVPLIALPGRADCSGPQVRALATSLSKQGRLYDLLAVGAQYTAADQLTWAVDPALLADASTLARCGTDGSRAAAAWLSQLRKTTAGQQLFATPYANVSLALLHQTRSKDVNTAFDLAWAETKSALGRDVASGAGQRLGGGTAWPANDVSVATLYALIEQIGTKTVVLPSDTVAAAQGTSFTTQADTQFQLNVLLASSALTQLLASSTERHASGFAVTQGFLAETAVMARQGKSWPIVVAPPQHAASWQPSAPLAAALLKYTSAAPWLTPASLSSLASGPRKSVQTPTLFGTASGAFSPRVLAELRAVANNVTAIGDLAGGQDSPPATEAKKALAALESANWPAHSQRARLGHLQALARDLHNDQTQVQIVTGSRVTLGGLKGNVPVVISNRLNYTVYVRIDDTYSQPPGGGLTISQPGGKVTVPAHRQVTTTLHVQATQVGSTTITLRLLNTAGHPLPTPARQVTVQATQFGTFAMIILAAVLGLFVIASAVKAIRRERPEAPENPGPPDDPDDPGHPGAGENEGSQQPPEPDNVVPERSELGATGSSVP